MRTLLPNIVEIRKKKILFCYFCYIFLWQFRYRNYHHIKKNSESDEEGMKATQNRKRYNVGIGTM